MKNSLLEARDLQKKFAVKSGFFSRVRGYVRAVQGVSFEIAPGETLGLVGESGCGKTTVARLVLRLHELDAGALRFDGEDVGSVKGHRLKLFRKKTQMVFQDPYASLDPRMRVGDLIAEPMEIHESPSAAEKKERVESLLAEVGLDKSSAQRYPHEFSGGQRQRIGIARAISLNPRLVVADEPVSALDVSVSAQVIQLFLRLQSEKGMSYLFISHDLKVVRQMSHRVAVMYLGKIVELAPKGSWSQPLHPYSKALIAAIPVADPTRKVRRVVLSGEIPSPMNPPSGCSFHPRCPFAEKRCSEEEPELREWAPGHWAACHLIGKI